MGFSPHSHPQLTTWPGALKRGLDVAMSLGGLCTTAPLMAAISVAVRLSMGSPAVFQQERPGLHGRPFRLFKFRTMSSQKDPQGKLLPDEQRLTSVGRFLRATSLDELPQFYNVLRGEMSFVGPRPLMMAYLQRYSPEQARRHDVRPGITGWAQIHGRNTLSWDEKFSLDTWYVDHWNLLLDFKIMAMTVRKVFLREGISSAGHATMPEFLGPTTAG